MHVIINLLIYTDSIFRSVFLITLKFMYFSDYNPLNLTANNSQTTKSAITTDPDSHVHAFKSPQPELHDTLPLAAFHPLAGWKSSPKSTSDLGAARPFSALYDIICKEKRIANMSFHSRQPPLTHLITDDSQIQPGPAGYGSPSSNAKRDRVRLVDITPIGNTALNLSNGSSSDTERDSCQNVGSDCLQHKLATTSDTGSSARPNANTPPSPGKR